MKKKEHNNFFCRGDEKMKNANELKIVFYLYYYLYWCKVYMFSVFLCVVAQGSH